MALTDPAFDGAVEGSMALDNNALDSSAVGFGAAAEAQALVDTPAPGQSTQPNNILDPGFDLTLRPMRYPQFFDMYRDAIKNTWTVDEIDFSTDLNDLDTKITPAERHLVNRLVAFFCLLYTSPSPRDATLSRMPSSA